MIYTYENAIMKPFMIHVFTYYTFICTHINFGPAQRLEQQIILDKNIVNDVFVSSLICVGLSSLLSFSWLIDLDFHCGGQTGSLPQGL